MRIQYFQVTRISSLFLHLIAILFLFQASSFAQSTPSSISTDLPTVTFLGSEDDAFKQAIIDVFHKNERFYKCTYKEISDSERTILMRKTDSIVGKKSYFQLLFSRKKDTRAAFGSLAGADYIMDVDYVYSDGDTTWKWVDNPNKRTTVEWILGMNKENPDMIQVVDYITYHFKKIKLYFIEARSNKAIWTMTKRAGLFGSRNNEKFIMKATAKFIKKFPFRK